MASSFHFYPNLSNSSFLSLSLFISLSLTHTSIHKYSNILDHFRHKRMPEWRHILQVRHIYTCSTGLLLCSRSISCWETYLLVLKWRFLTMFHVTKSLPFVVLRSIIIGEAKNVEFLSMSYAEHLSITQSLNMLRLKWPFFVLEDSVFCFVRRFQHTTKATTTTTTTILS